MQEREPEQVREKAQETKPEQVREKVQDEEQGQARKQTSAIEADKESVLQSEPQIHDEDYFIRKMRERVKAYHERSSSAEVLDRGKFIVRSNRQNESGKLLHIGQKRQTRLRSRWICLKKIS